MMGKRRIILTQSQINEICGGDATYLDGLALSPDIGNIYASEITADGAVDNGYAKPTTTDDYSHDMTNNYRGNAKLAGLGPITVREMRKSDWEKACLSEEEEHGNSRLANRNFGADGNTKGKSYTATKMSVSRLNRAENLARNGATPEIRRKAAKTINTMRRNWATLDTARNQYNAAEKGDKIMQSMKPEGEKIASAPKEAGNGQAKGKGRGEQNGIITYFE